MAKKEHLRRLPDAPLRLGADTVVASVPGVLGLQQPLPSSVLTLGTFDGVHLGHQELIGRAVARAEEEGLPCVAYTFDPHPAKVLAPQAAPSLLITTQQRVQAIAALGVDVVVVEPFTKEFSSVSADEWVQRFVVERLHPKHVVVGFNFSYGRGRGGDPDHLRRAGERFGFTVDVVEAIEEEGGVISSTRIRSLLLEGDVSEARRLLGRPHAVTGQVVRGDGRGRKIGVPTANLEVDNEVIPAAGVYATWASLEDGRIVPSVTNIGRRPTFEAGEAVEAHLFDLDEDLYGQRVALSFESFIRPEKKFSGVDALIEQIHKDVDEARSRLRAG